MNHFIFSLICIFFSNPLFARFQGSDEASHKYSSINQYYKVKKDGTYKGVEEREVLILNETGRKDYGFIKLNYSPNTSDLKIIEAYTITDGKKNKVTSDMIEDKPIASQMTGFDNTNQVSITFPDVKIGSKIYLKYNFERNIPSLKEFFSTNEFFGWKENIEKQNVFIESELELFTYIHDPNKVLTLETKKDKNLYYINATLTKPVFFNPIEEKDPYLQRTATPYIEFSSQKKWSYVMLQPIIEQNENVLSQELPEKLTKIIVAAEKINGFENRVNFLIKEIQEHIRYFGDWRPIKGALIPRDLKQIIETGFGDCKDYSALLTVMLRKLGYDSHIAWVYRAYPFIMYDINLPSLNSYNHAITYASYENKDYWFDATNNMVFTNAPLNDIANRDAVILAKNESIFKFIPAGDPQKNITKLSITYDNINSPEVNGHAILDFKGIPATEWTARELGQSKAAIENRLLEWVTSSVRNITERKFTAFDLTSRISTDYKFDFTYKEKNTFYKSNYGKAFILWENTAIKQIGEEIEKRETDLFLRYPKITEYHFKFNKAKTKNLKSLECKITSKWLDVIRKVYNPSSGLEVKDIITVKQSYISSKDYSSEELKKLKIKLQDCMLGKIIILN